MDRRRGHTGNFFDFGDPFAGFGGFGGHGSLLSSFFGGRDPFDDPFFNRPFDGILGPSMFGSSMFGSRESFFRDLPPTELIEHEPPQVSKSKGPVIKELNSDGEEVEEEEAKEKASGEKRDKSRKRTRSCKEPYVEEPDDEAEGMQKDKSRKHFRSCKEPYVEEPDEEAEGRMRKHIHPSKDYNRVNRTQPHAHSFSFQTSSVSYSGADGTYYTSSKTRRTGSDGVTLEESKEADTATRQAAHRISRGLHDKGHSISRKLNSDGRVDTMQTLHNLNEDELGGFEEAWSGSAQKYLPGWNERSNMFGHIGGISSGQGQGTNAGRALPSTGQQQPQSSERMNIGGGVRTRTSKRKASSSTRI